ncbi:putative RNA methyltransferase [Spirochaetia bacterium]|nr:putative RNA methyltransferase [Spirochaetia bacterium]
MIRGESFTAPVERLAAGGAGIARSGGLTVFIDLTVPGDVVTGRITGIHKNWAQAELTGIVEPSPNRVTPRCPWYGRCGGCSLQQVAYQTQITEKAAMIRDAFTRIGGFSALPELKIVPSPPFEYRNRVQLHCYRPAGESETAQLGFMGRNSGELVPVTDCPVAVPGIRCLLADGFDAKNCGRPVRRFTVYAQGDRVISEVPSAEGTSAELPSAGGPRGTVAILGREIRMDAGVFFQSNAVMLEALIPDLLAATERADGDRAAADIYCGVGTFAAFLQDRFTRLDLIEENTTALGLARENIRGTDCQFFAQTDTAWVRSRNGKDAYGFAVTDPPRQGLSPAMRQWLAGDGPPVLVYISCDPATLARDSRDLCRGGYRLESLAFYDFYPQTAHIESLAVFLRDGYGRR